MFYKIVNGSVAFGTDTILEQINFEIRDKEKIAIVGRNGSGKTTLLRAIVGEIEMEEGTSEDKFLVSKSGGLSIGYLKQIVFDDTSTTLHAEILKSFSEIVQIEKKLEILLNEMQANTNNDCIEKYSTLSERFENLGGYTYKKEYMTLVRNFGFSESDLDKKLSEFSGGQQTKIAFIKLLLSKPDILILDEPTNHLDVSSIEWLEGYLKKYNSAIIIVSHDRMFLNNIVDKVYEIEYGETREYKGNYSAFEIQKRENYEKQLKDHKAQKAEIERLTKLIERFRYKATKASMVQSKIKMLEKMQIVNPPNRYDLKTFHANFQPLYNSYKDVLKVKDLVIGYDKPLAKINFSIQAGEKLGIIGQNGIGKSTFLKTVYGSVKALGGYFNMGENVALGYFDQQTTSNVSDETVFDNFYNEYPMFSQNEVRTKLGAFMFTGEDVFKPINSLSGGEKVRLALCKILGHRPNVLILDEPTNHLDIVGKESLENMLQSYKGTIIFVSHDRYFVNKLATKLLIFENGSTKFFDGTYAQYNAERELEKEQIVEYAKTIQKQTNPVVSGESKQKGKFSTPLKELSKNKNRLSKIEKQLKDDELRLKYLREQTYEKNIYSDFQKFSEVQKQIESLEQEIKELESEWENVYTLIEQQENEN